MGRSGELVRNLDASVLSVAAAMLWPANRHRRLPDEPRRIGIIQPTAIGDTIIASGAVAAIGNRYPDAAVSVFHGPSNAVAVKMIDAPINAVSCDFTRRPEQAFRRLRAAQLDLVVDMTPWTHLTAILARLSSRCAVGFAPAGSARGRLFDIAVPHRADRHELENLAALANVFHATGRYDMRIRLEKSPLADTLPLGRLVLCQLCAGGRRAREKAWPMRHWAALCSALIEQGYIPAFTGVADDQKAVDVLLDLLGERGQWTISLCGKVPLSELGDLMRSAFAVVSVDTSILHLAGAVGARIFGLHGPTWSARWGSRSPRGRSFDSPHPDAGYIKYGTENHPRAMEIMESLSSDAVIQAILTEERLTRNVEAVA